MTGREASVEAMAEQLPGWEPASDAVCAKCGTNPVGPGGILCPSCRAAIEARNAHAPPSPKRTDISRQRKRCRLPRPTTPHRSSTASSPSRTPGQAAPTPGNCCAGCCWIAHTFSPTPAGRGRVVRRRPAAAARSGRQRWSWSASETRTPCSGVPIPSSKASVEPRSCRCPVLATSRTLTTRISSTRRSFSS
jgi:hypothetical protein